MKTISDSYVKLLKEVTQLRYAGKLKPALQLIESYLSKTNLIPEEQIRYAILKGSILNTMGVYKGLTLLLDELIEEINAFNLPVEYLEANLLKIDALNKLSQREDCITLINDMEDYLTTQKEILPEKRKKIKAALLYQKGDHFLT